MKKALALSGGGSKGAYTVGVLKKWVQEEGREYDIVAGASTGALIAPMVLLNDIERLENIYTSVRTTDIYTLRPLTKILSSTSLTSTLPLWNLIKKHLTDEKVAHLHSLGRGAKKKIIVIGCYRLADSTINYFHTGPKNLRLPNSKILLPDTVITSVNSAENPADCLRRAILASSNQPAIMPTLTVPRESRWQYVDGGLRDALPGEICAALGADSLDAVMLTLAPIDRSAPPYKKYRGIFNVAAQALNSLIKMSSDRSMSATSAAFAPGTVHVVRPESPIIKDSNKFIIKEMKAALAQGYRDAQ